MKQFQIQVISKKPKKMYGLLSHTGEITIGDYKETFVMPLNSWTLEEYKQQWKEGVDRLKTHNESCLVNLIQNMNANPMVEMWTLHKVNNTVYIQQQLLNRMIAEELNIPIKISEFNSKTCYKFINHRIANEKGHGVNEDGEELSEWNVNINDILKNQT